MAETDKKHVTQRHRDPGDAPALHDENSFDLSTSGIPGRKKETAMMLGRDGKWLAGGELPCYATGRADRRAPAFPGINSNLRGVADDRE
jgi:hypothetical protein